MHCTKQKHSYVGGRCLHCGRVQPGSKRSRRDYERRKRVTLQRRGR